MTRWHVALPWLMLVVLVAAPAAAQQDQAQARKHFVLAQAHEKNGDYAEAAAEYIEAYKHFASPEFFYNAGRAYELGGDPAKAVEHYERYLALDPKGRAAANARASIEKLEPLIVTQPPPPQPEPATPTEAPEPAAAEKPAGPAAGETTEPAQDGASAAPGPGDTGADGAGEVAVTAGPAPKQGSGTLQIAGLSLAGVGLVATVVGVKFAMDASSLSDEIEGVNDQWTRDDLAKFDEGERARTMSIAFTGIGVAALVTGGALYLWGRSATSAEERRQTSMTPLLAPSSAGFVVTRHF